LLIVKHGSQVHNDCIALIMSCNTAVNVVGCGIGFGPYTGAGGGQGASGLHASQITPPLPLGRGLIEPGGQPLVQ
jgi:hypothetical protein